MNNQTFILAGIVLCSFGGWYVVVTKYLALKKMIKDPDNPLPPHIPGMGPPPVGNVAYIPEDDPFVPQSMYAPHREPTMAAPTPPPVSAPQSAVPLTTALEKRQICNYACILHLSGFAIITGVPFLNIMLPAIFWLWKKETHPFFAKQGREVINFQITYTLIQFLCLGAGVLFIRYMPATATKLFAFTKVTQIVFSSGMHVPYNVFTVLPFFWCCIVMVRGAVAAYHGINYKYPVAQQFIYASAAQQPAQQTNVSPTVPPEPPKPAITRKVSFG